MMNTLTSRLINAGLIAAAVVFTPLAAFAQDAAPAYTENASNFIGALVVWLLPIGGLFAVGVMIAMDKGAQASRIARR
jgi:cell division protein FtsX